jgi:hypothetical protein
VFVILCFFGLSLLVLGWCGVGCRRVVLRVGVVCGSGVLLCVGVWRVRYEPESWL